MTYVHDNYNKLKMDKQASCMRWGFLVRLFFDGFNSRYPIKPCQVQL